MNDRIRVSLPTKILSNFHYLKEVSVEGKTVNKFNFLIGWYDLYANQIIRTGNCITLLSTPYNLTIENFWNTNHFEDISKYVFWTFNDSFRQSLIQQLVLTPDSIRARCQDLLTQFFIPYNEADFINPDEELLWCFVKNSSLKKSGKYELMYSRDQENRAAIISALDGSGARLTADKFSESPPPKNTPTFLSMLIPISGSQHVTLKYIDEKIKEAGCKFEIFRLIRKSTDNRNPYGFNGCVAAVIDHFYQLNYFDADYSLEQIFQAYFEFTGNNIPKFSTFMSEFRQDQDYARSEKILRKLEAQYNLTPVQSSKQAAEKSMTKNEMEMMKRTDQVSSKIKLQTILSNVFKQDMDVPGFIAALEKRGVNVMFNQASTGFVSGISYGFEGMTFKGSALGNSYKWALVKSTLHYEQERDHPTICEANARARSVVSDYGLRTGAGTDKGDKVMAPSKHSRGKEVTQGIPGQDATRMQGYFKRSPFRESANSERGTTNFKPSQFDFQSYQATAEAGVLVGHIIRDLISPVNANTGADLAAINEFKKKKKKRKIRR